jgi:hypothetical protein
MRNSAIVFGFFGIVVVVGIIFSAIILPKMDFGRNNIDIELTIPFNKSDLRFIQKGVTPFCTEESNSIRVELREGSPVLSSIDGIVTSVESGRIDIKGDEIYVFVYPLKHSNVVVGDYVTVGDVLGYVDGNMLDIGLDNYKDSRYECSYLYMDEEAQTILSNALTNSLDSGNKICECSSISY